MNNESSQKECCFLVQLITDSILVLSPNILKSFDRKPVKVHISEFGGKLPVQTWLQ